ncbi:MAG: hypothetical protein UW94_C0001G0002 [Parcubacteria group bacterium GW2011_GWA2_45_14]|nr:MAG: hypothetical protein UW94_C0001G0002 [Parcubacteria group bacterium GW2011_GWA2_45_14]OGY35064.1 MAG: hypothetical protein A3B76_04435 [Candidatus Andersenbacteria bacterium RIFCSPHIGHO2_02_FULL_46_16]
MQNQALGSHNVLPGGFTLPQVGIQNGAGVVIKAGNQVPLHSRIRRIQMVARVMLDEFAGVVGDDFPVMNLFLFLSPFPVPPGFGPVNDRGNGRASSPLFCKRRRM